MSECIFNAIEESLILDFAQGKIGYSVFAVQFGLDTKNASEILQQLLVQAAELDDSNSLDLILTLGFAINGISAEHVPVLCVHLLLYKHNCHEQVASVLQNFRCSCSLQTLVNRCRSAPQHANSIDGGDALFRKCIWAIHDIGTPEAHASLEQLISSENDSVRKYSMKRLDEWNPSWRDQ